MRSITGVHQIDGIPTKFTLRKCPRQRRFQVLINKQVTEYVISDDTDKIEHYDGLQLDEKMEKFIINMIIQYFPNTRPTQKIGEDDYEDYDDY